MMEIVPIINAALLKICLYVLINAQHAQIMLNILFLNSQVFLSKVHNSNYLKHKQDLLKCIFIEKPEGSTDQPTLIEQSSFY